MLKAGIFKGPQTFGSAIGLFALLNLPVVAGSPALTGYLFAVTGSYAIPFLTQIVLIFLAVSRGITLWLNQGHAVRVTTA
jgi:hypothetical protein